jgi:hypothetical protein
MSDGAARPGRRWLVQDLSIAINDFLGHPEAWQSDGWGTDPQIRY